MDPEQTVTKDGNGPKAVMDASDAAICWLPGWKKVGFSPSKNPNSPRPSNDTVTVTGKFRTEILIRPDAVTNLRTNIEDRNLWDKAFLCRAMGAREWLPFQFIRDIRRNSTSAYGIEGLTDSANLSEHLTQQMDKRDPTSISVADMKWILKPADGNKASGIKIFEDINKLEEHLQVLGSSDKVCVIQEYLEKPWLIEDAAEPNDLSFYREKLPALEGKKFDMRMFYLVTYEPAKKCGKPVVRAYLHRDGICRFSTADYDPSDLSEENKRAHLTCEIPPLLTLLILWCNSLLHCC